MSDQGVSAKLAGIIPPMVTPMTSTGEIDIAGLHRLVDYLLVSGVTGIFVLGSSGEGPWLTLKQNETVIRETVKRAGRRVPVLAGLLEPSTQRTLQALRAAEAAGADAVVITTPYYFEADAAAQAAHIRTVAAATDLPVVLYNIPSKTHNALRAETVSQLLDVENLAGIKDSSGDWDQFAGLLALRQTRPDFRVLQGAEGLAGRSMLHGADGLVPGMGNLVPDLFLRLYTAGCAGDAETVQTLQARLDTLGTLHTYGHWLVCLKYAASLLGFGSGATASRPNDLPDEARRIIQSLLTTARQGQAAIP